MTDAPKIDTQAPRIGTTTGIDFGTGKDTRMLTLMIDGKLDHASADGPWGKAILALLAERDISAAREAAAAQAMREAAIALAKDLPISEIAVDEVVYALEQLPAPDHTALDRLIAERVRATFDEAIAIVAEYDFEPLSHDLIRRLEAARGSKEGQS